jgi:hypothetical protein
MFQERYSESHPGTAFPTNYEQVLMVATDCIGWLPWAFHNHLGEEIVRIDELFTRCMKMLSEGANNG